MGSITRLYSYSYKRLFNVHYLGQFVGTIAARSWVDAIHKAPSKFGTHIIKDINSLEVVDAGKYEGDFNDN